MKAKKCFRLSRVITARERHERFLERLRKEALQRGSGQGHSPARVSEVARLKSSH